MKKEANRITVTLPPDLSGEANEVSSETGVSLSDLLRQGMIRILLERREAGSVKLMQLPKLEQAAAA
jgi:metal-responsive CopG/Arc/MetJ family transcriptional regulator